MRWMLLWLGAGCGFHGAGITTTSADDAPIEIDASLDGAIPMGDAEEIAIDAAAQPDAAVQPDAPLAPAPPFALTGARWLLPCSMDHNPNPTACHCGQFSQTVTITGSGQWHVTARIQGVMEKMGYQGGAMVGSWYQGGTPVNGGDNIYEMLIGATTHYYINVGTNNGNHSYPFDFMATFDVAAGTTVKFTADGQDTIQWMGVDATGNPISVPGVTTPAQPYDGQWARLDVITATAF